MDFKLTETQQMVKDTARKFAETEIKPVASQLDKEHRFPTEIVKKLGEMGFMGVAVPEKYGGAGLDNVSYVLVTTEIAKACASTAVIMSVNNSLYCFPLLTFANEEQKEKYLKPVASGKCCGCYGLTEAGAGSDAAALKTTAVLNGDHWIINGTKIFTTNGAEAKYMVFAAITDKTKGYKGISQFVMDCENTPGFKVGKLEDKLGIKATSTAEMIFEDSRIPKENILGDPGAGFRQMLTTLDSGRIGIGAQAVGIGRAILEEALEYAKERHQFGKPISSFQAIQWKLADIATELDAAEMLLLRAAWLEDNGLPFEKEAAMAKLFCSDIAMKAAVEGVQILGGYGYVTDYPMERHLRDAKICQIYEGTNEVMRLVIARRLLK